MPLSATVSVPVALTSFRKFPADTGCASCALTSPRSDTATTRLPFTSPSRNPSRTEALPLVPPSESEKCGQRDRHVLVVSNSGEGDDHRIAAECRRSSACGTFGIAAVAAVIGLLNVNIDGLRGLPRLGGRVEGCGRQRQVVRARPAVYLW